MSEDEALELIRTSLKEVGAKNAEAVTAETDLVRDNVLDSLDLMNFLFELEKRRGNKIEEINETFDDFRVATLISFLSK